MRDPKMKELKKEKICLRANISIFSSSPLFTGISLISEGKEKNEEIPRRKISEAKKPKQTGGWKYIRLLQII